MKGIHAKTDMTNKPEVMVSQSLNPWFNLATEQWIFSDMTPDRQLLFIWRNTDTVVIGRNQNPWKECNIAKMEKDNVYLARRESGGGAVFHDKGNTNFTFLSGINNYSVERNFRIVTDALSQLGLDAVISGRNDITADGKKISGSAFKLTSDRAFHHGTLLISADLSRLSEYLSPSILKLKSKGIESARSRVANISDFIDKADHTVISSALTDSFFNTYGRGEIKNLDSNILKAISGLEKYYRKMESREWRYGAAPDFSSTLENRFEWGSVEISTNTSRGMITETKIFTDSLVSDLPEKLEPLFTGKAFDSKSLKDSLTSFSSNSPDEAGKCALDIALWLETIL